MATWGQDPRRVLDTWTEDFAALMVERAGQRLEAQAAAMKGEGPDTGGDTNYITPEEMAAKFRSR